MLGIAFMVIIGYLIVALFISCFGMLLLELQFFIENTIEDIKNFFNRGD